jgi:aldehyde dehydrogenase (NAD+)
MCLIVSSRSTAASRVLVEESIAKEFCLSLVKVFETVSAGMGADPLDASTQHGPVVDQQQFQRVMGFIAEGKRSAQLLTGGSRIGQKGAFIQPTIFLNPATTSSIWKEEIFGPVLTVKTFRTEEEAIELANDTEYGLACKLSDPILQRCWNLMRYLHQHVSTPRILPEACVYRPKFRLVVSQSIHLFFPS